MANRRIVVTGLGAVSPLGNTATETWDGFVAGRSGIGPITLFPADDLRVRIAGEVKNFSAEGAVGPKELRQLDRSAQFAIVASREAMADCGLEITDDNSERIGVVMGTCAGGFSRLLNEEHVRLDRGPDRVAPLFVPYFLVDAASGVIAMQLGAQGPNMDISTACATGTNTIGEAYEMIYRGDADAIITGGTEASIAPVIFCGFINMRALSTRNDDPTRASRPFDRDRDGFVIGEGASVMILEELEHALARGAKIYCEVVGYATGNDAYHMVSPAERGTGAVRVMRAALRKAAERSDLCASEVDYVNAHGSSTPLNDKYETDAVKTVFGAHAYDLTMTSTKSMVGHLFGGAGSIEAFACVKAIETGWIPPTINLDNPDPECDLDYTPNVARQRNVRAAISNGFGLGGHNACVIFRRFSA